MIAGPIAALAAGLFAGAALFVSVVEHPARVSGGPALAVAEFRPSYRRAAVMQTALAVVGTLAAMWRSAAGGGIGWLLGGLVLVVVIPFTLVVIGPTNKHLLDPALRAESPEAAALLARWGRLHAVRSACGATAFAIFLALLGRA